jgi:hypothetical protein
MQEQETLSLEALSDLCTPWCVHVVATLRIADHIAAGVDEINGIAEAAGCGALLAEILRAHPGTQGTLVDFPQTVPRAAGTFEAAGVAERVRTVGQSFFDPLPAGADSMCCRRCSTTGPTAKPK